MFAQTAVAPGSVGIEVIAYLKLVSTEKSYFLGGDMLLSTSTPCAAARDLHFQPIGFDRNVIGAHLASRERLGISRGIVVERRAEGGLDGQHTLFGGLLRNHERLVSGDMLCWIHRSRQ